MHLNHHFRPPPPKFYKLIFHVSLNEQKGFTTFACFRASSLASKEKWTHDKRATFIRETLCESERCINALKKRRRVLKEEGQGSEEEGFSKGNRRWAASSEGGGGGFLRRGGGGGFLRALWRSFISSTPPIDPLCVSLNLVGSICLRYRYHRERKMRTNFSFFFAQAF